MDRPSVFSYGNYRSFLDDFIRYLRDQGSYSNRAFAEKAGFKSHTYVNLILKGTRDLTEASRSKVAKELGLSADEGHFFKLLVDFNQTTAPEDKDEKFKTLRQWVRRKLVNVTMIDQFELFSNWTMIAILESITVEWKALHMPALQKELSLSGAEIKQGLATLERLKLVEQNAGKYRKTENHLTTGHDFQSLLVRNFHKEMTELALQKLSAVEKSEREFNALTFSLTDQQFQDLRLKIREFAEDVQKTFLPEEGPKAVYHLNLQLFPILSLNSKNPNR